MSRRKYLKGPHILSLDQLAQQEFVYFNDKLYHFGWFSSWQLRMCYNQIGEKGRFFYAVPKGDN